MLFALVYNMISNMTTCGIVKACISGIACLGHRKLDCGRLPTCKLKYVANIKYREDIRGIVQKVVVSIKQTLYCRLAM